MYCNTNHATIMCHGCKSYYHLICGHTNKCLSQFIGEFKSYCRDCLPLSDEQKNLMNSKPPPKTPCYICRQYLGMYSPTNWISAKCCKNGYIHSLCLKKYALKAGYYLKCIWCKKNDFREDIKYMGIFVPDRDADWEREKDAYRDLHRSTKRCDMTICHCPKGRMYTSPKWSIITCILCGLVGAHNPLCIPDIDSSIVEFKCDTCSVTELTIVKTSQTHNFEEISDLDMTLKVTKCPTIECSDHQSSTVDTEISNDSIVTIANPTLDGLVPHLTQNSEDLQTSKKDSNMESIEMGVEKCEMNNESAQSCDHHTNYSNTNNNTNTERVNPTNHGIEGNINTEVNNNPTNCDIRTDAEDGSTEIGNHDADDNNESDEDPSDYAIQMAVDHFISILGFKK
ncbi:sulfiredoxin isoform X2 [Musca autumnalis]|uniref:sulfiredoxin isoform X2 n=1 Tax=Musca autumnalis TaxID=221902 RepID=UPI003CF76602